MGFFARLLQFFARKGAPRLSALEKLLLLNSEQGTVKWGALLQSPHVCSFA